MSESVSSGKGPTSQDRIIVYGHPSCLMVPPVMGVLKQASVVVDYVNIRQDPQAAQRVREINTGNESVPTLVFPDGSTLTEPSTGELVTKLEAMGYHVPLLGRLLGNSYLLITLAVIVYAVLRFLEVI